MEFEFDAPAGGRTKAKKAVPDDGTNALTAAGRVRIGDDDHVYVVVLDAAKERDAQIQTICPRREGESRQDWNNRFSRELFLGTYDAAIIRRLSQGTS
ncbi:MAG TPA: hypothetical protein VHE10_03435 [Candidatus Paceibacterota bacterium]|nr:hypothetical protein [Candidatus Paceibacterota bacterium]